MTVILVNGDVDRFNNMLSKSTTRRMVVSFLCCRLINERFYWNRYLSSRSQETIIPYLFQKLGSGTNSMIIILNFTLFF